MKETVKNHCSFGIFSVERPAPGSGHVSGKALLKETLTWTGSGSPSPLMTDPGRRGCSNKPSAHSLMKTFRDV